MITIVPVGTYRIEPFDVRAASDDDLRPIAELSIDLRYERTPEDGRFPLEAMLKRLRAIPDIARPAFFVARSADRESVALASIWRYEIPENRGLRETGIEVHPGHRRRGLGRALFARLLDAAGDGATLLTGFTNDRVAAGGAFARRLGATPGLVNRTSQLDLGTIDRELVRRWAAIDPAGYRLEWITEPFTPDRLMPNVVVAYDTMNTAPRDALQEEDWTTTPELVRDFERMAARRGVGRRLVLAIAEGTGETAGFTEVNYDCRVPAIVGQNGTAVVPAHRGRGIGKWMKARMIERIFAEWPEARIVRTGNAYSNAPMLSINDRLGFKVTWSSVVWQLPIADACRHSEGAQG